MSADIVVASRAAIFRFTETALGLVVTSGFTAVLPRTAGGVVAKEIIMLGEPFDGEQAKAWGLVNRTVDDDDLQDEVDRVVGLLREKAPTALRLAKRLLDQASEGTLEDAMGRETACPQRRRARGGGRFRRGPATALHRPLGPTARGSRRPTVSATTDWTP